MSKQTDWIDESSISSPRQVSTADTRRQPSTSRAATASPVNPLNRASDSTTNSGLSPSRKTKRLSQTPRSPHTMPQYTSRDVGDPSQIKKNKQSMADLKLRRLTELNNRLREDLERERIPVSQASKSIIAYCNSTRDYMVPSVWGPVPKGEDPYAPPTNGGCCVVM
ncbi:GGL domain-containing protein [Echria macrotheca]|uniref:Guanine nucleotide-binding protein subunit gamma n=1 Tax=Echria macrotheca TaxID=438768 RepID=A0AAJ0BHY9_9PEZI|nr:GGL domain-containing protein [Echria macrotheca]